MSATFLVVFRWMEHRYALPLTVVERVLRAVAVTPLPGAPAIVLGVIQIQDRVLPVIDARRRFRLPEREIEPADHFLVARTSRRAVVLAMDEVEGVIERSPGEVTRAEGIVAGLEHVRGVTRLNDDLVMIHDLEEFLSLDEEQALDAAISKETVHGCLGRD